MRAAIFEKVKEPLKLDNNFPTPSISGELGQAVIEVVACGVCHTDFGYLEHGVPTVKPPPLILGHEISGRIKDLSEDVTNFKIGDHVIIPAVLSCGYCNNCRTGRENICSNQKMIGNHIDGGFAELIKVPIKDIVHLPNELPIEDSCIISDAISTPYHAVKNRGQVRPGDWVVVIGCGGIGLNVVQNVKVAGGLAVAVDIIPEKLEIAKQIGAEHTILAKDMDDREVVGAIRKITSGGADIVFEAIGNPVTMKQGFNSLRTGGRLVAVGYSTKRWDGFDIGRVMFREMEVIGSLGCRPVDYPHIIELVKNGSLQLKPLITHKFPLTEINEAFDVMRRGEGVRILILCQK
ncbi:MAG: zinc-binding dehydrogenase [Promethearchaeota archaeon]|jgi:6-hydroxycyclohex-1-ene-1-carbonyl-CoA dehydrogenase